MLGFRSKGRFRLLDAYNGEKIAHSTNNFLAASNKYGLVFSVQNSRLNVIETTVIRNHVVTKENFKQDIGGFPSKGVDLGGHIEQISCNCDGSLLAVVLHSPSSWFALVYDVRCFLPNYREGIFPLCIIHLPLNPTQGQAFLTCFEWNPGVRNVFAVCGSDGTVVVYQVENVDKFTVEGVLTTTEPKAVCLSWSPKGKQLVVGFSDCSLCQFKPNLQPAKKIEPINSGILGLQQATMVNVCWLSTTHFVALCREKNDANKVSICHVTLNKEGPPTFKNFDDVCFGTSTKLKAHYYILHIIEWKLMICCSTNSIESAVIGWNSETKSWESWTLDDEQRAELPLDRHGNETFPVGACLDLILTERNALPIFLVLSTDGLLCPFQMDYKGPNQKEPICKPREIVTSFNDVKFSKNFAMKAAEFFASLNAGSVSSAVMPAAKVSSLPILPKTVAPAVIPASPVVVPPTPEIKPASDKQIAAVKPVEAKVQAESAKDEHLEARMSLLRSEIAKMISVFENDVQKLKESFKQPLQNKENMDNDIKRAILNVKDADASANKNKDVYEHLTILSSDLYRQMMHERASLEVCNAMLQKRSALDEQIILKQRPLTPAQKKFLDDTQNRIESTDQMLNDLLEKFGVILSNIVDKNHEKPKPSEKELIYRTLTNMQSIILVQRQKINELRKEPKLMKKKEKLNESDKSIANFNQTKSILRSRDQSYRTPKPEISFVARDTPLKRFLLARTRVPTRVTTPAAEVLNAAKSLELLAALKKADDEAAKKPIDVEKTQISASEPKVEKMQKSIVEPLKPTKGVLPQKVQQLKPVVPLPTFPLIHVPTGRETAPTATQQAFRAPKPPAPPQAEQHARPPILQAAKPKVEKVEKPIIEPLKPSKDVTPEKVQQTKPMVPPFSLIQFPVGRESAPTATQQAFKAPKPPTPQQTEERTKPFILEAAEPKVEEVQKPIIIAPLKPSKDVTPEKVQQSKPMVPTFPLVPVPSGQESAPTATQLSFIPPKPFPAPLKTEEYAKPVVPETTLPLPVPSPATEVSTTSKIEIPQPEPTAPSTTTESTIVPVPPSTVTTTTVQSAPVVTSASTMPPPFNNDTISAKIDESMGDMEAEVTKQDQNTIDFSFNICKPSTAVGGLFSGLGGAPKPESVNKNVFGSLSFGQSPASSGASFGSAFSSTTVSPFGAATTTTTGFGSLSPFSKTGASTFTNNAGSVAQQGFGSLGATSTASSGGSIFGSGSTFGGSPIFGGKSAFGGSPTIGTSSPGSGSIFGGGAQFGGSPSFGGQPAASAPTAFGGSAFGAPSAFGGSPGAGGFAAFASGGNAPSFGSLAGSGGQQQQQQQQQQVAAAPSIFGGSSSLFGGSTQKPSGGTAFSQWR